MKAAPPVLWWWEKLSAMITSRPHIIDIVPTCLPCVLIDTFHVVIAFTGGERAAWPRGGLSVIGGVVVVL